MERPYKQYSKVLFSHLLIIAAIAMVSSCSNSKHTASFQKVPSKNYGHAHKSPSPEEAPQMVVADLISEITANDSKLEIPDDLLASLDKMGVSEKKSAKILKRVEKLNEALEKAKQNPDMAKKDLSFGEKMIMNKALKKADKILAENNIKDIKDLEEAQKTQQMNNNVRIGLILILLGIIAGILWAPLGGLLVVVGIVFLIIGLLET